MNGVCEEAQSLCDLASPSVALQDNKASGSVGLFCGNLSSLPAGTNATLSANPLDSAVAVPLTQTGLSGQWTGCALLTSVGQWSVGLTVGGEQCSIPMQTVLCMPGFEADDTGRCACPKGQQNIGGKCQALDSLCNAVEWNFQLESDREQGANSRLRATITLPDGIDASITAAPLDSTVAVPLLPNSTTTWEGVGSLATTGEWSIGLTVGEEQCVVPPQKVACMPGFNDDGKGRCECPSGTQNNAGICELTDCSDGSYRKRSEATTAQRCETCILGHFCLANSSALNPIPCPPGRYRDSTGGAALSDCAKCSIAHYSSAEGETSCARCPVGHTSNIESTAAANCTPALEVFPSTYDARVTPEAPIGNDTLHVINVGVFAMPWELLQWQAEHAFVRATHFRFSYDDGWEALAEPKGTVDPRKHLQVLLTFEYGAEMTGEPIFLANSSLRVQGLGSYVKIDMPVQATLIPLPGKPSPANTVLQLPGFEFGRRRRATEAFVGEKIVFTLVMRDSFGKPRTTSAGDDVIGVKLVGNVTDRLCLNCQGPTLCCVRDMRNGEYGIEYAHMSSRASVQTPFKHCSHVRPCIHSHVRSHVCSHVRSQAMPSAGQVVHGQCCSQVDPRDGQAPLRVPGLGLRRVHQRHSSVPSQEARRSMRPDDGSLRA